MTNKFVILSISSIYNGDIGKEIEMTTYTCDFSIINKYKNIQEFMHKYQHIKFNHLFIQFSYLHANFTTNNKEMLLELWENEGLNIVNAEWISSN